MRIVFAMLAMCLAVALGSERSAAAPFGSKLSGADVALQDGGTVEKVHRRFRFRYGYGVPYYGYGYGWGYYPRYRYVPAPYYYYPAPRYYGYYGYPRKWKKRDWDDDWDD